MKHDCQPYWPANQHVACCVCICFRPRVCAYVNFLCVSGGVVGAPERVCAVHPQDCLPGLPVHLHGPQG
eukprot:7423602-Alexandrium_andersonii.AAC.1